jgi:hypothetical protein
MLFDVETVEATLTQNVDSMDGGYDEDLTTLTLPPTLRFNGHKGTRIPASVSTKLVDIASQIRLLQWPSNPGGRSC